MGAGSLLAAIELGAPRNGFFDGTFTVGPAVSVVFFIPLWPEQPGGPEGLVDGRRISIEPEGQVRTQGEVCLALGGISAPFSVIEALNGGAILRRERPFQAGLNVACQGFYSPRGRLGIVGFSEMLLEEAVEFGLAMLYPVAIQLVACHGHISSCLINLDAALLCTGDGEFSLSEDSEASPGWGLLRVCTKDADNLFRCGVHQVEGRAVAFVQIHSEDVVLAGQYETHAVEPASCIPADMEGAPGGGVVRLGKPAVRLKRGFRRLPVPDHAAPINPLWDCRELGRDILEDRSESGHATPPLLEPPAAFWGPLRAPVAT